MSIDSKNQAEEKQTAKFLAEVAEIEDKVIKEGIDGYQKLSAVELRKMLFYVNVELVNKFQAMQDGLNFVFNKLNVDEKELEEYAAQLDEKRK